MSVCRQNLIGSRTHRLAESLLLSFLSWFGAFFRSRHELAPELIAWCPKQPGPEGKETSEDHFANFIRCVISRKKEDLRAPIEEGYISAGLVHLANASYRLGRTLTFDPVTEQVKDDDEANQLLKDGDRGYRPPYVVSEEG